MAKQWKRVRHLQQPARLSPTPTPERGAPSTYFPRKFGGSSPDHGGALRRRGQVQHYDTQDVGASELCGSGRQQDPHQPFKPKRKQDAGSTNIVVPVDQVGEVLLPQPPQARPEILHGSSSHSEQSLVGLLETLCHPRELLQGLLLLCSGVAKGLLPIMCIGKRVLGKPHEARPGWHGDRGRARSSPSCKAFVWRPFFLSKPASVVIGLHKGSACERTLLHHVGCIMGTCRFLPCWHFPLKDRRETIG